MTTFPTSNNAPLPIPGGYGNPTGANMFGSPASGVPFPTMPAYGGGPFYNMGSYGTGQGIAGLSSGFSTNDPGRTQNLYNYLGKAFGKGPGQLLGNLITQGLFNPQIAAAFLNAQQPGIARGEAGIEGAFADAGARFSSAAALGMGDYESQVQLNQQQTLASLFEHSQDQQLSLLENVLPSIKQERADEGGLFSKILGGVSSIAGLIPGIGTAIKSITGLIPHSSSNSSTSAGGGDLLSILQASAGSEVGGASTPGWQGVPFPLPQ